MTEVRVCPSCASAKVDQVKTVGRDADVSCSACGWAGRYGELIGAVTNHGYRAPGLTLLDDMSETLRIAQEVALTYMRVLAKDVGRPMGLAMVHAGVVGAHDTESMARLIKAACKGAHKATLDEIEKMQEEIQNDKRSDIH